MVSDICGELVKLMVELCSGGREPEDEKLLKDWCELNAGAVWERGMFQASQDIPPEPAEHHVRAGLSSAAYCSPTGSCRVVNPCGSSLHSRFHSVARSMMMRNLCCLEPKWPLF